MCQNMKIGDIGEMGEKSGKIGESIDRLSSCLVLVICALAFLTGPNWISESASGGTPCGTTVDPPPVETSSW